MAYISCNVQFWIKVNDAKFKAQLLLLFSCEDEKNDFRVSSNSSAVDQAFQNSPNGYTSYKLALDLIAFKALMNNSHTEGSALSYSSTIMEVQSIMSKLQGSEGGCGNKL